MDQVLTIKDIKEEQLDLFLNTAIERHRIYIRKEIEHAPKPWSRDKVFQDWFFCNLFRKLDKTSQFIIEKVIRPNEDNPYLWAAIIICRWYSWIPTIQTLIDNDCLFSYEGWKKGSKILGELQQKGVKICTSGFMTGAPLKGYPGITKNKIPFIIVRDIALCHVKKDISDIQINYSDRINSGVWIIDNKLRHIFYLEDYYNLFKQALATAGFMAYEYATDLTYSKRYTPANMPKDYYSWGNFTIGSLRGLKRLMGLQPNTKAKIDIITTTRWIRSKLQEAAYEEYFIHYPEEYDCSLDPEPDILCLNDISMREVEHWLCEYDKYCRIYNKEKRMKRRYNGRP